MTSWDDFATKLKLYVSRVIPADVRVVLILSRPGEDLKVIRNTDAASALAMIIDAQHGDLS